MQQRLARTLAALSAAGLVAACGSSVKLDEPTAATPSTAAGTAGTTPGAAGAGATAGGTPQSQVASVDLTRNAASAAAAPAGRIVYFDFDSFVVRSEFTPLIEGHARALAAARDKRLVIEGHTDERGSREYNLALGQKRAEAVVRSLALLGVRENQLEAVSFGEERPAQAGSDEAAWAKNRRAELKDR